MESSDDYERSIRRSHTWREALDRELSSDVPDLSGFLGQVAQAIDSLRVPRP